MAYRFVIGERVEFSETDMAGIVHFSNFFRYLERAEHGFVRSLGFSIYEQGEGEGKIGWPRVHASCDFKRPLRFEEEFEVELLVEEVRAKTIHYLFKIWKKDGELAAVARTVVVCVRKDPVSGGMKGVEIPEWIREKVEVAPGEVLDQL